MGKRSSNKLNVTAVILFLLSGCAPTERSSDSKLSVGKPAGFSVQHFGAMREVMREGKTEARIRLSDTVAAPHAYAVGALEGLAGEVTIVDGDVWVSRVAEDGELQVTGPTPLAEDSATLLTLGHVADWHRTAIERSVSGADLESLIERFAQTKGLGTDKPFPFRIEGQLTDIELHVINGYCPIATDPAGESKKPWRQINSEPVSANIIGFYAPNAVAVMTHHGTSVHAHGIVTVDGRKLIGHVDSVTVEPGATLFVPKL